MKKEYSNDMYISQEDIIIFPELAKIDLQNTINEIKSIKTIDMNFENVIVKYETSTYKWDKIAGKIGSYELCHIEEKMRKLASESILQYMNVLNQLFFDKDLYQTIMNYINGNYQEEKESLDIQDIKLIEDLLIGFKKSGFHLEQKFIDKIISIDKKINTLSIKSDQNLVKTTPFILCNREELSGVPENIVNAFETVIVSDNETKYKVSIQYPEYGPFMKYAENRKKRQELYKLFMNNGGKDNVKILDQLISLRKQKSEMIGFETHAHYRLVDRLAKHPDNVTKIIDGLISKLHTRCQKDIKTLHKEALKYNITKVENYDTTFLINKFLEREYDYDEQKLRQFLSLNEQIKYLFNLFEKLFDIKISEIKGVEKKKMNLWSNDVMVFEIKDKIKIAKTDIKSSDNYQRTGILLMDLFPRDGKFGHACMHTIFDSHNIINKTKEIPISLIVCNFAKPTGKTPSLVNMGELETLYHEAGHAIHSLLSKTKYATHFGTSVSWDFVELPSQIMELWLQDKKYLKFIAKHYKTGKSLDNITIDKFINMNKEFKAMFYMKQLIQSKFDMDIYTDKHNLITDKVKHLQNILDQYHIADTKDILFVSRFAHLYRGYDAGYYSYLWAEIIVYDVFNLFKEHGLTNKNIGLKYKKSILEKGSSRDEEESVKEFLGRKWNSKAFMENLKQ